jgi:hypothetical protein
MGGGWHWSRQATCLAFPYCLLARVSSGQKALLACTWDVREREPDSILAVETGK